MERLVDRLDGCARGCEPARRNAPDVPVLVGQLPARREVDPSDLEEPDPRVAGVDVDAGGLDEAVEQRRAQHRVLAAHRVGEA